MHIPRSARPLFIAVLGLLALASSCASLAAEWSVDQLMAALAQTRSAHASFEESKSIAILDHPVQSSGELFYSAPDQLEKRTLKPKPESMLLQGNQLTLDQRGRKKVLQLDRYPEVATFIDSIRGTLAGDRAALERSYALSLDGDAQAWTLTLLPRDLKAKQLVSQIRMQGSQGQLQRIAIHQADGDSSLMTITPLAAP